VVRVALRGRRSCRIAATIPDARLIAILREPAERAWSHFVYDRDIGHTTKRFEDIVATAGRADEHHYIRLGRYVRQLERLVEVVPREKLLVLWFDDVRDRPEWVWRQACGFLGLEPDPVPTAVGTTHNRHYRLRLPVVRAAMRRTQAWKRLPKVAARMDRLLRSEAGYEAAPAEANARLLATYVGDTTELAAWLGQPLPPGWAGGLAHM
jgi:hypothetical protein